MKVAEALSQIAEIHDQLTKAEVYRGFRPMPVALSGAVGFAAAAVQPALVVRTDYLVFVRYWLVVGIVAGLVGVSATVSNYLLHDDEYDRRRTHKVIGQFIPCLVAGLATTLGVLYAGGVTLQLLPGLWAILFALGVFSARPYLPRAIGWVGLYYLVAGTAVLAFAPANLVIAGWGMAGVFGVGQLGAAVVLFFNVTRHDHA